MLKLSRFSIPLILLFAWTTAAFGQSLESYFFPKLSSNPIAPPYTSSQCIPIYVSATAGTAGCIPGNDLATGALTGAGVSAGGYVTPQALGTTGTVTPSNPVGQITSYAATLTGSITINVPATMAANQEMIFWITESVGGGNTISFASGYSFLTGTPSFNISANQLNVIDCIANSTITASCSYPIANPASLTANQSWSAGQAGTPIALTDGSTIAVNAALGNNFTLSLTGASHTLSNPTGLLSGQFLTFSICNGTWSAGSCTTTSGGNTGFAVGTDFHWSGGTTPTWSTSAGQVDVISCFSPFSGTARLSCTALTND